MNKLDIVVLSLMFLPFVIASLATMAENGHHALQMKFQRK